MIAGVTLVLACASHRSGGPSENAAAQISLHGENADVEVECRLTFGGLGAIRIDMLVTPTIDVTMLAPGERFMATNEWSGTGTALLYGVSQRPTRNEAHSGRMSSRGYREYRAGEEVRIVGGVALEAWTDGGGTGFWLGGDATAFRPVSCVVSYWAGEDAEFVGLPRRAGTSKYAATEAVQLRGVALGDLTDW